MDPAARATPAIWRIDPADNVAVALRPIGPGETVAAEALQLIAGQAIPKGHKLALVAIPEGAAVLKYGHPIGCATRDIVAGHHVHSHNLATALAGESHYAAEARVAPPPASAPFSHTAGPAPGFQGYRRANGRVGTRNEIWILPTVACVGRTAERIARLGSERHAGRVDAIVAFNHPFGCSQLGDDLARTRHLLAALARHPNAGGVLLIGLGCESNQLAQLLKDAPDLEGARLRSFAAQSTEDETEAGLAALDELVAIAEKDRRTPCSLADLTLGVKCGGSDGFSGLTANPLVGRMADRVTEAGGAAVLTEIPEIFGAEQLLMARAADAGVHARIGELVNSFKRYFLSHGEPVSENPSPGNLAGGITTLEEKSLGAVQKGGHAVVTDVLRYGEHVTRPGLSLLEAPGNDGVSSTALVGAGATILLFTTGRGTPLGFPAPTLKISSNSQLAAAKPHWIDFDAGQLLDGRDMEAAADELLQLILRTASGEPARNETNGEREIAIWKGGVTL